MKKSTETPKPPTSEQIVRAACDLETNIAAGWIEAGQNTNKPELITAYRAGFESGYLKACRMIELANGVKS